MHIICCHQHPSVVLLLSALSSRRKVLHSLVLIIRRSQEKDCFPCSLCHVEWGAVRSVQLFLLSRIRPTVCARPMNHLDPLSTATYWSQQDLLWTLLSHKCFKFVKSGSEIICQITVIYGWWCYCIFQSLMGFFHSRLVLNYYGLYSGDISRFLSQFQFCQLSCEKPDDCYRLCGILCGSNTNLINIIETSASKREKPEQHWNTPKKHKITHAA